MIGRWIRYLLWKPFEISCRKLPLIPLKTTVSTLTEGVVVIKTDNWVTKAISLLGGNYDYSVCYLVNDTLLIDTGFPWARRSLRKKILELGLDKRIKTVVNTHCHEDHVGNNDLILELTEAKIYAHPIGINAIKYPIENPWYRNFMFGPQPSSKAEVVPEEFIFGTFHFQVLHMPGHSPDHICLFETNKKWLFSGDLYISADLDSQLKEVDGNIWIESLERAVKLNPTWMFDAHGIVISGQENVQKVLVEKLEFLKSLRDRIMIVAENATSINQITKEVFNEKDFVNQLSFSEGWLSLLTCSDFSRGNLVSSFLKIKK